MPDSHSRGSRLIAHRCEFRRLSVSVALALEYEDVLKRSGLLQGVNNQPVDRAGRHRGGIQIRIRAPGTFRRNRGNHAPRLPARLQAIERTTPPSARSAAPLIADANGLATNATTDATSSGVAKRRRIELGRAFSKNSFSTSSRATPFSVARRRTNSATPSDSVGPGSTAFTVTAVPAVVSARPRDMASWAVLVMP